MNEEKAGVIVAMTNRYSIWDGVAVAITDKVNGGDTEFRFYNGKSGIHIIHDLLKEGLEIAKIQLVSYNACVVSDMLTLKEQIHDVAPKIKVESLPYDLDPFKEVEIPKGH